MKREKIKYPKVKIIKPFFWKECRFCGKEFKRELGYKIEEIFDLKLYWSYCCNECAKDIEEVIKLTKQQTI